MASRDPEQLVDAAVNGDRRSLARLVSLVEGGGDPARLVGQLAFPLGGHAYTVGITGAPGAGKSTVTDRLIRVVRAGEEEVAVLAVDPSSPFTGGAFLGDRVRMQDHATDGGVFIRSMATRGHLGGLSLATRQGIRVLDAARFPWVLVETVGVGQVEIDIVGAADSTVVVLNPGAGDAVQANKAGLLEVADLFVINKADRAGVQELERDLNTMLDMNLHMGAWRPPIVRTVAVKGEGIDVLWKAVGEHRAHLEATGELERRRRVRLADELREIVVRRLEQASVDRCQGKAYDQLLAALAERRIDPYQAAARLLGDEPPTGTSGAH